jgi:hypothetical protein
MKSRTGLASNASESSAGQELGSGSARPSRRGRRGRTLLLLLAAAAVVITVAAGSALVVDRDPEVPPDLEQAVAALFRAGECTTPTQAEDGIRAATDALGYDDWSITSRPGVAADGCAAAGFIVSDRLIVLVPVNRPEVTDAMQGVAAEMMTRCLSKEQASGFIFSVLASVDVVGGSIRTDGPVAYPAGQEEAVRSHIASGCYVFSGSGHGADGQPIFYISGPDS